MNMCSFEKKFSLIILISCIFLHANSICAQKNLVLNGNFEDINTCTEYKSECGVEAWFYLSDVKIQMRGHDDDPALFKFLGSNSFGIYYNWIKYNGFTPVIGTILPCHLQKDRQYIFRGMIKKEKLNSKLILKPGIVVGENFYVPRRPFAVNMHPDSIIHISHIPRTEFFQFEYSFIANGEEKYLTFGTFIEEDTLLSKKAFIGTQTIGIVLDNFQLLPSDSAETDCDYFIENKEAIYNYNFRHKEMDYSLFGKGYLDINLDVPATTSSPSAVTRKLIKADTLRLSDVLFDFNKASLKPSALQMLKEFFLEKPGTSNIDSLYVEGHTDSIGSDSRNMELSQQRCESVQSWLLQNSILDKQNIQIHPFGKTKPVASNSTSAGRALNRRVELIIFRKLEN